MTWASLLGSRLVEDLAWTLIDSVWQITLVALALWALLAVSRSLSANVRYIFCMGALVMSLTIPVATYVSRAIDPSSIQNTGAQQMPLQVAADEFDAAELRGEGRTATPVRAVGPAAQLLTSVSSVQDYLPIGLQLVVGVWLCGFAARAK